MKKQAAQSQHIKDDEFERDESWSEESEKPVSRKRSIFRYIKICFFGSNSSPNTRAKLKNKRKISGYKI